MDGDVTGTDPITGELGDAGITPADAAQTNAKQMQRMQHHYKMAANTFWPMQPICTLHLPVRHEVCRLPY